LSRIDPVSTRVLGVDPGVSETGWAVLEGGPGSETALIASGVIRTSPATELPARLLDINARVSDLIAEFRPDDFAIEEMFFIKIANTIRATLQARGVILLAAAEHNTPVHEYNPRIVKAALTGSGSAPKAQIQKMVQSALRLKKKLAPDDVADAAAIGVCHLRRSRLKRMTVLEKIGGTPDKRK